MTRCLRKASDRGSLTNMGGWRTVPGGPTWVGPWRLVRSDGDYRNHWVRSCILTSGTADVLIGPKVGTPIEVAERLHNLGVPPMLVAEYLHRA